MKIYIAHGSAFDFKKDLYIPLRTSKLNLQHTLILPHENDPNPQESKTLIQQVDLVVAEVSYPSTGQGIELGWANLFNIPIICFFQENKTYSRSLEFISNYFFSYRNTEELILKLENYFS